MTSLVAQTVKHLPTMRDTWVQSLVGKSLWRRKWQPTPVFLPGKSHGWRSVVGYSPWGCKESDTTEQLHSLYTVIYHDQGWNDNIRKTSVFLKVNINPVQVQYTQIRVLGFCRLFWNENSYVKGEDKIHIEKQRDKNRQGSFEGRDRIRAFPTRYQDIH